MMYRTTPPPAAHLGSAELIDWAVAESLAWPAETPQGAYPWWVRHAIEVRLVRPGAPLRSLRRTPPTTPMTIEASQPIQLAMEL